MLLARTIGSALAIAFAVLAAQPVLAHGDRPPNANTRFDHVLVFPAGAGDQVIETWRQRASSRLLAGCIDSAGCRVRSFRFHVSAGWQLPMVGIAVEGRTRLPASSPVTETADMAPVWLAGTSIAEVRLQVAAIAGH